MNTAFLTLVENRLDAPTPPLLSLPLGGRAGSKVTIGRGTDCDVILPDSTGCGVFSRKHFTITLVGVDYFISDLGSLNGTFVDGVEVPQHVMTRLTAGQEIAFGAPQSADFMVRYRFVVEAPERPSIVSGVNKTQNRELFDTPYVPDIAAVEGSLFDQPYDQEEDDAGDVEEKQSPLLKEDVPAVQQILPLSASSSIKPRVLFPGNTPSSKSNGAVDDGNRNTPQMLQHSLSGGSAEAPQSPPLAPSLLLTEAQGQMLKSHQATGVQFLWQRCVMEGQGAVLAHAMGLGKTLTVITFLQQYCERFSPGSCCLILAPKSVLCTWKEEMEIWAAFFPHPFTFVIAEDRGKASKVSDAVLAWESNKSVVLAMSHHLFCGLYATTLKEAAANKRERKGTAKGQEGGGGEEFAESRKVLLASQLVESDEDAPMGTSVAGSGMTFQQFRDRASVVVVDEGHKISSKSCRLYGALSQVVTKRRIVLTGTPVHNRTQVDAMMRVVLPLHSGDILVPHDAVSAAIDSVSVQVLRDSLPPLHEYVIYVIPSELQRTLYNHCLSSAFARSGGDGEQKLLCLSAMLGKLCAHTDLLKDHLLHLGVKPADNALQFSDKKPFLTSKNGKDVSWAQPLFDEATYARLNLEHNPKLVVLLNAIKASWLKQRKCVVFSQWNGCLDIIEKLLAMTPIPGDNKHKMRSGVHYTRWDPGAGSTSMRSGLLRMFNEPSSPLKIMLLPFRSGSHGLNVTGASDMYLYDVTWNPHVERQAIFRSYRYGQTAPVNVFRIVAHSSMEQMMLTRCQQKLGEVFSAQISDVLHGMRPRDLTAVPRLDPEPWEHMKSRDDVLGFLHKKQALIHSVCVANFALGP